MPKSSSFDKPFYETLAIFIKRYAELGCFLLLIIETANIITFDGIPSTINMNNIPILTFDNKSLVNSSSQWSSAGPKSILEVFIPSKILEPLNFVRLMLSNDSHFEIISQIHENLHKVNMR